MKVDGLILLAAEIKTAPERQALMTVAVCGMLEVFDWEAFIVYDTV